MYPHNSNDEEQEDCRTANDSHIVHTIVNNPGEVTSVNLIEHVEQRLTEADHIHGDSYRICQSKHQSYCSPELWTQ